MTFDFTPEQHTLVANASSLATLPQKALDAVIVVEERVRQAGEAIVQLIEGETDHMRARLIGAATALGIGRAAIGHAIAAMKTAGVIPGPDAAVPHWAVADGATDVEAARLLTYSAAQAVDRRESAETLTLRAFDFAARAAQRAVDAATRVVGPAALADGSPLDRLARDARRLQVILR